MADSAELGGNTPEARINREFIDVIEELTDTKGVFDGVDKAAAKDSVVKYYLFNSPVLIDGFVLNSFTAINGLGNPGRDHVIQLREGLSNPLTTEERPAPTVVFHTSPNEPLTYYSPSKNLTGPFEQREPLDRHETLEKYTDITAHLQREIATGLILD